jgi:histidyl-tRNA synthetase
MNDILPSDIPLWEEIEQKARDLFGNFQYQEIRTPVLEDMALFTRTVGETTNIVEKEMYVFQDRNGKWVSLRPEGTASVVRAYIEHIRPQDDPVARYFYIGPMYRYERPQKGRFRQFYQLGVEAIGIASPRFDAEVINMLDLYFRSLGLNNLELEINSLGCQICRPKFLKAFLDFLMKNEDKLCSDCKRRMERNPLRTLDCHQEACRILTATGPSIQDHLCDDCEKNFDMVLTTLGMLGTSYKINPKIVRGLDYYLRTTFEFTSNALGSQNAVAGGGRYDGLVRLMGGPNVPGFGFAIGLERLIDILRAERGEAAAPERRGIFLAVLGEAALETAMKLAKELRAAGIPADLDYEMKSLKSQMRKADKTGAQYVAVLGDDELKKKSLQLKEMATGTQEEISLAALVERLKK